MKTKSIGPISRNDALEPIGPSAIFRRELRPNRSQVIGFPPATAQANSLSGRVLLVDDAAERASNVILMDCRMPVMVGFDTTRLIRASEKGIGAPQTPIIGPMAEAIISSSRSRRTWCRAHMGEVGLTSAGRVHRLATATLAPRLRASGLSITKEWSCTASR